MTLDDIIDGILEREGDAYTNDPADAGGPTRHGITLGDWADYTGQPAKAVDIQALTASQARTFYRHRYIVQPGFDKIGDPWLQAFLVDMAVLQGRATAIRILQKCLGVEADGVFGPVTRAAASTHDAALLKAALIKTRVLHLIGVALVDVPKDVLNSTNLKWIRGWTNRALSFL